jgi:hypothetical protein
MADALPPDDETPRKRIDGRSVTDEERDSSGMNDEAEFAAWFDGEYGAGRWTSANWAAVRVIAQAAFRQGLAVGREGRA